MSHLSRDQLLHRAKAKDIALVYSRSDLNEYMVELITSNKTEYIHRRNHLSVFHTIDEALRVAKGRGASDFYLCMENTYDEFGPMKASQYFSYVPIHAKGRI